MTKRANKSGGLFRVHFTSIDGVRKHADTQATGSSEALSIIRKRESIAVLHKIKQVKG